MYLGFGGDGIATHKIATRKIATRKIAIRKVKVPCARPNCHAPRRYLAENPDTEIEHGKPGQAFQEEKQEGGQPHPFQIGHQLVSHPGAPFCLSKGLAD